MAGKSTPRRLSGGIQLIQDKFRRNWKAFEVRLNRLEFIFKGNEPECRALAWITKRFNKLRSENTSRVKEKG